MLGETGTEALPIARLVEIDPVLRFPAFACPRRFVRPCRAGLDRRARRMPIKPSMLRRLDHRTRSREMTARIRVISGTLPCRLQRASSPTSRCGRPALSDPGVQKTGASDKVLVQMKSDCRATAYQRSFVCRPGRLAKKNQFERESKVRLDRGVLLFFCASVLTSTVVKAAMTPTW